MVTLRMRECHPTQKTTHSTILGWLQNEMPMVGHELVTQYSAGVTLEPFGKNSLECLVVTELKKDLATGVTSVQRMINLVCLIGAFWSWHPDMLTQPKSAINDS
jgi:hypothetical protein